MKYKLPYFNEIDSTQLEECFEAEISNNAEEIMIDLNFEGTKVDVSIFDNIKTFLENIQHEDFTNRKYIAADFENENGTTVKEYIEFHTEELKEELSDIVNFHDKENSPETQLLKKLKLGRIGFYPDGKYGAEAFVVFDYVVDRELSDQIIVVNRNKEGKLINLSWES